MQKSNFYSLPQFSQVSLLYSVELNTILAASIPEKIQYFVRKKYEGTDLFNRKDYSGALEKYYQALSLFRWIENKNPNWNTRQINDSDLVHKSEEMIEEVKSCLITSYLNIAICDLKLEQWKEAELACEEVLKIDEKNVKALYRKAQAISSPMFAGEEEYQKSIKLLELASQLDPKNIIVSQKLNEIRLLSKEKTIQKKNKKSHQEAKPNPFASPLNELDDMVAKWEYMVNNISPSRSSSEFINFQKNLEKIKKYKTQLKDSLIGLSENELLKLKTNKFGIDISDYIHFTERKEAKRQGNCAFRTYPLVKAEPWRGWFYICVCILAFVGFTLYSIESKEIYNNQSSD